MISQKEFILGCVLGGILGTSAALLLPRLLSETDVARVYKKAAPRKTKPVAPSKPAGAEAPAFKKPKKAKNKQPSKGAGE